MTISKSRFVTGVTIFVLGQATTLLIPFVAASGLSSTAKTVLNTLFFFVIPQIGIVCAVAVLGKSGYEQLKGIIFSWLKKCAPPETVSLARYRIGLIMFMLPILFGWVMPYVGHLVPGYEANQIMLGVAGDVLFVFSFFVLGGEFWDKVRALFVHKTTVLFPEK